MDNVIDYTAWSASGNTLLAGTEWIKDKAAGYITEDDFFAAARGGIGMTEIIHVDGHNWEKENFILASVSPLNDIKGFCLVRYITE